MSAITDWRGIEVPAGRSRGGVLALADPLDNVIWTGVGPWPAPELVQKLYRSRQEKAFSGADLAAVTEVLGYYCDLQSLHSEDAITWSVFGTLIYAKRPPRAAYLGSLFESLGLPSSEVRTARVWLWRRLPHPDTLVPGGPEIDFAVQAEDVVVLGEAKWMSGIGRNQGTNRDKDQLALRTEFIQKHGEALYPDVTDFCLLTVSRRGGVQPKKTVDLGSARLHMRDTTWDDICSHTSHPCEPELSHYLAWKEQNSRAV